MFKVYFNYHNYTVTITQIRFVWRVSPDLRPEYMWPLTLLSSIIDKENGLCFFFNNKNLLILLLCLITQQKCDIYTSLWPIDPMKTLFSFADERALIWLQNTCFRSTLLTCLSPRREPNYDLWPLWSLTYMMDSVFFSHQLIRHPYGDKIWSHIHLQKLWEKKSIFRDDFLAQKND